MNLISSETAPTIDALGIRFTLADRDGDYACHVLRSAMDLLGDTAASRQLDAAALRIVPGGKFERLGAEMRASGHVNPWIKPESVAALFVDVAK